MFSKPSRYRAVPDAVAPDARSRVLVAKDARPLPDVTGTFTHIVEAGDRLDQLAARYYGQPLLFWHICDANPQFLSPLALVGQEPVVTTRFPVTPRAAVPPWADLVKALSGVVGVTDVTVAEDVTLVPQSETVMVERFDRSVSVTHNRINVGASALAAVIDTAGFTAGPPVESGQLGQQIVIPAAVTG